MMRRARETSGVRRWCGVARAALIIVFMMQMLPNGADVIARFQTLLYSALMQPTN